MAGLAERLEAAPGLAQMRVELSASRAQERFTRRLPFGGLLEPQKRTPPFFFEPKKGKPTGKIKRHPRNSMVFEGF